MVNIRIFAFILLVVCKMFRFLCISLKLLIVTSLVSACASPEPAPMKVTVDNLYSPDEVAKASLLTTSSLRAGTDDNYNGISDSVDSWITQLDEDYAVKTALTKFARSVQSAVLFRPNVDSGTVIVYNLIDAGTDVFVLKGEDEGRRLLDSVASKVCDTRGKAVKYASFLNSFAEDQPETQTAKENTEQEVSSPSMI